MRSKEVVVLDGVRTAFTAFCGPSVRLQRLI